MTFLTLLWLSGAAAGVAALGRALPWPKSWLKVKPWVCSSCVGGHAAWMTLLINWQWYGWRETALLYFFMTAVAALSTKQLFPTEIELPMPGDE